MIVPVLIGTGVFGPVRPQPGRHAKSVLFDSRQVVERIHRDLDFGHVEARTKRFRALLAEQSPSSPPAIETGRIERTIGKRRKSPVANRDLHRSPTAARQLGKFRLR